MVKKNKNYWNKSVVLFCKSVGKVYWPSTNTWYEYNSQHIKCHTRFCYIRLYLITTGKACRALLDQKIFKDT